MEGTRSNHFCHGGECKGSKSIFSVPVERLLLGWVFVENLQRAAVGDTKNNIYDGKNNDGSDKKIMIAECDSFSDNDISGVGRYELECIEMASKKAIELFGSLKYKDPVMRLNEYYSKNGIQSIQHHFRDERDSKTKGPGQFWRCTFTCPLGNAIPNDNEDADNDHNNYEARDVDVSPSSSGVVSSCLPFPLLLQQGPVNNQQQQSRKKQPQQYRTSPKNDDDLLQMTINYFSRYRIVDGSIYFATKKAAKKSAALSMLLKHNYQCDTTSATSGILSTKLLAESKDQARRMMLQLKLLAQNKKNDSSHYYELPCDDSSFYSQKQIKRKQQQKPTQQPQQQQQQYQLQQSLQQRHLVNNHSQYSSRKKPKESSDNFASSYHPYSKPRLTPRWVLQLYQVGVTSAEHVTISYRECLFKGKKQKLYRHDHEKDDNDYNTLSSSSLLSWNNREQQPTMLRCIISITQPAIYTIVSDPYPTKQDARENALETLVQITNHNTASRKKIDHFNENNNDLDNMEDKEQWTAKKKLKNCDSQLATYCFPLPVWAVKPVKSILLKKEVDKINSIGGWSRRISSISISGNSNDKCHFIHNTNTIDNNKQQGCLYYLYELVLKNQFSGELLASERIHIDPEHTTRIGIIFPSDIEPPVAPSSSLRVRARLRKRKEERKTNKNKNYYPVFHTTFQIPKLRRTKDEGTAGINKNTNSNSNDNNDTVSVSLVNRCIINIKSLCLCWNENNNENDDHRNKRIKNTKEEENNDDEKEMLSDRLKLIEHFNRVLFNWKTYGIQDTNQCSENKCNHDKDNISSLARGYMFVPLVQKKQHFNNNHKLRKQQKQQKQDNKLQKHQDQDQEQQEENKIPTGESEASIKEEFECSNNKDKHKHAEEEKLSMDQIDWELLSNVYYNQTTSYFQSPWYNNYKSSFFQDKSDIRTSTCLVDFITACSSFIRKLSIFGQNVLDPDLVSWTAFLLAIAVIAPTLYFEVIIPLFLTLFSQKKIMKLNDLINDNIAIIIDKNNSSTYNTSFEDITIATATVSTISTYSPRFSTSNINIEPFEKVLCLLFIIISILSFIRGHILSPRKKVHVDYLNNHFLIQKVKTKIRCVYVTSNDHNAASSSNTITTANYDNKNSNNHIKTARSQMLSKKDADDATDDNTNYDKRRYGFNIRNVSYFDYYLKRYGQRIRHPGEILIPAHVVNNNKDFNHFLLPSDGGGSSKSSFDLIHLIPEFVHCLPMPRDILYIVGSMTDKFMPKLEREINLHWFCYSFDEMSSNVQLNLSNSANFVNHDNRVESTTAINNTIYLNKDIVQSFSDRNTGGTGTNRNQKNHYRNKTFASLLQEATTLRPIVTYQRFEFLGDAVLSYMLSINCLSKNSLLEWDSEDLNGMISFAVTNNTIYAASLRAGLHRLLETECTKPWLSIYDTRSIRKQPKKKKKWKNLTWVCTDDSVGDGDHYDVDEEISLFGYQTEEYSCCELAESQLADVVESLLAALYLRGMGSTNYDVDPTGGALVVGMLDLLSLPLTNGEDGNNNTKEQKKVKEDKNQEIHSCCKSDFSPSWFRARGPCLRSAYPFHLDHPWPSKLAQINAILFHEQDIAAKLNVGYDLILKILMRGCTSITDKQKVIHYQLLGQEQYKILLLAALFDDNLEQFSEGPLGFDNDDLSDNDNDDQINSNHNNFVAKKNNTNNKSHWRSKKDVEDLQQIALLRDTLYIVGANALRLMLTEELHGRFCEATAGDLHLLRACAMSDDVVVYIMIRAGLHQALYEKNSICVKRFLHKMIIADRIGASIWAQRGGWILQGGIEEYYHRRRHMTYHRTKYSNNAASKSTSLFSANATNVTVAATAEIGGPQYPGLAGGRLYGQGDQKIEETITSDLGFSFKAIVGALVLSLGTEAMWDCIGPLFEEVMLLSPDELRLEFREVSTLCNKQESGLKRKKNKTTK